MHHKKGWISKRKEGLFRFKLHLNKKNNKYEKHFKTKWVPESFVARCLIDLMNHELEQQILEDVKNE